MSLFARVSDAFPFSTAHIGQATSTYTTGKGCFSNAGNDDDIARPSIRRDETDRVRQEHRTEVAGCWKAREASAGRCRAEIADTARWGAPDLFDHGDSVRLRRVHS